MAEKKNIDWNAVKNRYISEPETSFRSLGEEFGISASAIHRRAKEDGWAGKRERFANNLETKTLEKLTEERARGAVKRIKKLYDSQDKLAAKVAEGIKKVSPTNTLAIRQLVSSLKELRAMEGLVSAPAETGDEDTGGVVILADVEQLTPPEEGDIQPAVDDIQPRGD
ncbi:MAG: hypothetical protein IJ459_01900 [Clostridia bacterium]|nr:hypothetical protein [Clostridia bacterium]